MFSYHLKLFQGQIRGGRSAAVGTSVHQGSQGQAENSLAYSQGQGEYSQDSSLDHDSYHSHNNQPQSSESSHFVYQIEEI